MTRSIVFTLALLWARALAAEPTAAPEAAAADALARAFAGQGNLLSLETHAWRVADKTGT